jgi:hypothetical protein
VRDLAEGRHISASRRVQPAILVAAGVAVLAVSVLLFALLSNGNGGQPGLGGGQDDPESPELTFQTTKIVVVPTRPDARPANLQTEAEPAAALAARLMDHFYTEAFLDRDSWLEGVYDEAWDIFDAGARARAQGVVETLTAGTAAADAFETIEPTKSTLRVKVLFDGMDHPHAVVAIVRFAAEGAGLDGSRTTMLSLGQFFLERVEGQWKVVSFQVKRDNERRPAGGATGTTTPSPGSEMS